MNTQTLAQVVAGKVRSAQRVKFRRLMGSTYDRNQKRWKDSKEVREFLKLADTPPSISSPAKEGPVQKYTLGCNVRYSYKMTQIMTGKIQTAKLFFNPISGKEEVEYLIFNDKMYSYWINQSNIMGLVD